MLVLLLAPSLLGSFKRVWASSVFGLQACMGFCICVLDSSSRADVLTPLAAAEPSNLPLATLLPLPACCCGARGRGKNGQENSRAGKLADRQPSSQHKTPARPQALQQGLGGSKTP